MQENKMIDWLIKRGITPATIELFEVSTYTHPQMGEVIQIPIHDRDGYILFSKYRRNPLIPSSAPKYVYEYGTQAQLYGWWQAQKHNTVLIVEGELDALVAWSQNVPAVSSTGGCMTWKDDWTTWLKKKNVIICYDNDNAGHRGAIKLLGKLPHASVMFIPDLPNMKDLTDYVVHGGKVKELLRTAKAFSSIEDIEEERAQRLSVFESIEFHDEYIKALTPTPVRTGKKVPVDGEAKERAKAVPIDTLLEVKKRKALCPWHNDTQPSLYYYPDTNSVYCFTCGAYGDSIDVYKALHNCSFKVAVNALTL